MRAARPYQNPITKTMKIPTPEIWFVTGSQHLYGPGPLKQVADNSREIVEGPRRSKKMVLPLLLGVHACSGTSRRGLGRL